MKNPTAAKPETEARKKRQRRTKIWIRAVDIDASTRGRRYGPAYLPQDGRRERESKIKSGRREDRQKCRALYCKSRAATRL
jgi:hypothetical protein